MGKFAKILFTEPSGQVKVWICKSDYRHNSDLGSTWLPKFKREEFAARLQQGVPKEKILEDIRNSVSSKFQRHHLADKQDLKNIRKASGLDDVQQHTNDQDSVLAWIQGWHDQKEFLFLSYLYLHFYCCVTFVSTVFF